MTRGTPTDRLVSRRQMVGLMSAPVAAAALASCTFAGAPASAPAARAPRADDALAGARTFNIRDFGAVGDGAALDTAAVQAAIDACTSDHGGTVLVPAGVFLIGAVELKSNVTLRIAAGGKLLGAADAKQYHAVQAIPLSGDTTLGDGDWALLFAVGAANITIEGPGMIEGNGAAFHPAVRGQMPPAGLRGNRRPYLLLFYQCTNLTVRNIDLFRSAYHCLRVIQSTFCHFDNIHMYNRVAGNNDGFHFISSRHVSIDNCKIESQDDACALFGSCRDFTITNSTFSTRWSVFRFGGGSPENIAVSNCILSHVYGCPMKFEGNPGSVFQNISFANILLDEVTGPITISIGPRHQRTPGNAASRPARQDSSQDSPPPIPAGAGPEESATSHAPCLVRNISFSNIRGTVATNPPPELEGYNDIINYRPGEKMSAIVLNAVGDSRLEDISLDNIHLTFGGGGTAEDAARRDLPDIVGEYFALGPIPAYGLYARNVHGLTLQNIRFQVAQPELRPAIIFDRVTDAALNNVSAQATPEAESLFRFINTKDTLITAPRLLTPAAVFLRIEGANNANIIIDGGDLSKATKPLAFAAGATDAAVKVRG